MADDGMPPLERVVEDMSRGIERAQVHDVEVSTRVIRRGLARFANNVIGQHQETIETETTVRVLEQGRVALASTSHLGADAIARAILQAKEACALLPPIDGYPGFGAPGAGIGQTPRPAAATLAATPATRTEMIAAAFHRAAAEAMVLSGTVDTTTVGAAVVTTAGRRAMGLVAHAGVRVFALTADGASGYAGQFDRDVAALDAERAVTIAMDRCRRSRDPMTLEPGEYDVVLEPPAVAELIEWLSIASFSAREVEQGTSLLAGRAGERVTGEQITIDDDPALSVAHGVGLPFDREGTPASRVSLIERGRAGGPVLDRLHAARVGKESTGHAFMSEGEIVPTAQALHLHVGTTPPDELVRGLERGIHVSRFHYVNGLLDTRRAVMTGMTRDGTFWVENGKPVRAIRNMRFTDSILDAFARADAIGDRLEAVPPWWSDQAAIFVPAMRIRGLRFTGRADAS